MRLCSGYHVDHIWEIVIATGSPNAMIPLVDLFPELQAVVR